MKKSLRVLSVILVFCFLFFTHSLSPASGISSVSILAPGSWSTGTELTIDLEKYPAPYDYFQQMGQGVKITEPGEICHPFIGGQFNWVGNIRRLVDNKWVKVATTQGWLNGVESPYVVCAQAPYAGTYALFAYYNGPKENSAPDSCAADLTFVAASPTDYVNTARNVNWDGESWSTEDVANWNISMCNLPVLNASESTIVVVVRTANNTCATHTIAAFQTEWISGSVIGGDCPLAVYEGAPD